MTTELNSLINALSVEAGVVPPVSTGALGEDIVHRLDDGSGAFVAELNTAEEATSTAEHLEELADRAEAAAVTDDPIVAQISAESLNREFGILARAKRVSITTDSFESGSSDEGRLQALARDARAHADTFRTTRARVLDFSPEGKLMEFLRRDRSRLENANKDLDDALHLLTPAAAKFKESGVFLSHDGFRRFLTVGGSEVGDVAAAFSKESSTLEHMNAAVVSGLEELAAAAKKLLGAGVKSGIASLRDGKHFTKLQGLGTAKGGLLGNYTIAETAKPGKLTGLSVPVYDRKNEHSFSKMGLAKGVGTGAWQMLIGSLRHSAANAMIGKNGSKLAHGINDAVGHASDAAAVAAGVAKYAEHVNKSKRKTAATYQELVSVANEVKAYSKFTAHRVNLDDFESTLRSARNNTATLDAEEKSDLKAIISALEDAASRIMRLESAVYQQAVYTTTMVAQVIKAAVDKID